MAATTTSTAVDDAADTARMNTYYSLLGRVVNARRGFEPEFIEPPRMPVPLKMVSAHASVVNTLATVRIQQTYENTIEPKAMLECVYVFPMDPVAVLVELRAVIGATEVVAAVSTRDDARTIYKHSLDAGAKAALLERDQSDIYTMYIGNLGPGEKAVVDMSYATELGVTYVDDRMAGKFVLPTAVAPRYGSRPTAGRPPADALIVPASAVEYRLNFKARFRMSAGVEKIWSPSHPNLQFATVASPSSSASTTDLVDVTADSMPLDRDLVILSFSRQEYEATAFGVWSADLGELAVAIGFLPSKGRGAAAAAARPAADYVLVLDRSGSMTDSKMEAATDAGVVFLKALPATARFGIVDFNHTPSAFGQLLAEATSANVDMAIKYLKGLRAGGGTETARALELAYKIIESSPPPPLPPSPGGNREAYVLVVTDGQVGDSGAANSRARHALQGPRRVTTFALAIGYAVSMGTVSELAEAGGGAYDSCLPSEGIVSRVMGLVDKMFGEKITGVKAVARVVPESGWREVFSTGHQSIPVHAGTPVVRYTIIGKTGDAPPRPEAKAEIDVSYASSATGGKTIHRRGELDIAQMIADAKKIADAEARDWEAILAQTRVVPLAAADTAVGENIDPTPPPKFCDSWLHKLAAGRRVRDLGPGAPADTIRELGMKYGIMTSETSFVGLSLLSSPSKPGAGQRRVKAFVPIALPRGEVMQYGASVVHMAARSSYETAAAPRNKPVVVVEPPGGAQVVRLIAAQNADGRWTSVSALQSADNAKTVDAAIAQLGDAALTDAFITAIMVQVLRQHYANHKITWKHAVAKARVFLKGILKQLGSTKKAAFDQLVVKTSAAIMPPTTTTLKRL